MKTTNPLNDIDRGNICRMESFFGWNTLRQAHIYSASEVMMKWISVSVILGNFCWTYISLLIITILIPDDILRRITAITDEDLLLVV